MKKMIFKLKENTKDTLLIILTNGLAIATLTFAVLTFKNILALDGGISSTYLGLSFASLALTKFLGFFSTNNKIEKARAVTLLVYCLLISVLTFFARFNYVLYYAASSLYILSIIISRVFYFFTRKRKRDYVLNIICILFSLFLTFGILSSINPAYIEPIMIIVAVVLTINAFVEVVALSFMRLKAKLLFDIIRKTYAIETLFGLVTLAIAASLIFPIFEPDFNSFTDGMWYSFITITTIGFGDIVVKTNIGKILTVLLGIYGIIAVAVVTSIIVNFYSSVTTKKERKDEECHEEEPQQIESEKQEENVESKVEEQKDNK